VKKTRIAFGWLLGAACLAGVINWTQAAEASGALTLPFTQPNIPVNSWFDHTFPLQGSDTNPTMTRYDGTTGWLYNGHNGIDFGFSSNSTTVAAAPGVVQFIGWESPDPTVGFGFYVRVWHSGPNYSTLYGHLQENYVVAVGQSVSRGQLLGYSGNTGHSDGPHLHFGVYNSQTGWTPMDPYGWSGVGSDPWSYDIGYMWTTNPPSYPPPDGPDTWHLRNSLSSGGSYYTPFAFGADQLGDIPVTGDWDGDGRDGIGVFRPSDGTWHLRNSLSEGVSEIAVFTFGQPGDIPVVGDWDGIIGDGIGVWRPGPDTWHLRNSLSSGGSYYTPFAFGDDQLGDIPVTGDWDGNGRDGIGVWRPGPDTWHLRNSLSAGGSYYTPFAFGDNQLGDIPVTGDWDGIIGDGIGVWR